MTVDCGRMGTLAGLFICDVADLAPFADDGQEIYFGEVLGKHSDIYATIKLNDNLRVLSTDPEVIYRLLNIFPDGTLSGFNPVNLLREQR